MTNKQKYREFCKREEDIPVFSKDWWFDSVCGEENWDVVLIEKDEKIKASMPYYKTKRAIFDVITMPKLTQTMGPYIKYPEGQKYNKKLSLEKKIMNEIIEKLPHFDYFSQNFHYSITNWLPFYWKGFEQTTRYTYVLEDLSNLENIFNNFSQTKKQQIRKAEKIIDIKFDLSARDFYENHKMTLLKQNSIISYGLELFETIYNNGYKHNSAKTIYAIDKNGNINAAYFIIWDQNSAYHLISTIDPDFRNSGASTLLIREVIKFASTKTKKYDFEGSMIENVESSFRAFNALQKAYCHITKTNSSLLKIKRHINDIIK